ncbi:DsbA family protein [Microbulbifer agarilyticus]|uniref:DsbA family protein n=1 Tax=Microbulbifer agarilyticus TaxID=260552 RepID=UPI001CD60635|nr:DsbA family protein [Microbulbifer agarilyticus]MCA0893277.1 DsbA family protein [Microbulbifer agarilyticus]
MAQAFKEQGGAATMDPGRLLRWLTSKVMTRVCAPQRLQARRDKAEAARQRDGAAHVVEYFHQVDDGYSHLAAQMLGALAGRYGIELVVHLVSAPSGDNVPEPELLARLSRVDAALIAPHFNLRFPAGDTAPAPELVEQASAILCAQSTSGFLACAAEVDQALWAGDRARMQALATRWGSASGDLVAERIAAGNTRRRQLKHYSGAMFFYGDEWYWGVDRLYHLERRLAELGADQLPTNPALAPRLPVEPVQGASASSLTLEFFASLRSPYTAVCFDRVVAFARAAGIKLVLRPVLPMVMRGVPATREKGMYIFTDAAREARAAGVAFGNFYDPIGDPVRRAYALYPWACKQGREVELMSCFLRAAFAEGINTNKDRGLRYVVEQAGLDWQQAQDILTADARTPQGERDWENVLEGNREVLYQAGLWGVPSFRLLDQNGREQLAVWGQDRLWLVARTIQKLLAEQHVAGTTE